MLAQLSTVKTRLAIDQADTADDVLLTNLIKLASGRFSRECNRVFDRGAGVTWQFRANEMNIRPERPPIEAVTLFELKTTEAGGWVAVSPTPYYLIGPQLNLVELITPIGSESQLGRLTYTGGFVLPGTTPSNGQTALPDEVEQSCIDQTAYWYQNRNRLGITSMSAEGGSVQSLSSLDLLPHVKAIVKKYERWVC